MYRFLIVALICSSQATDYGQKVSYETLAHLSYISSGSNGTVNLEVDSTFKEDISQD